MKYDRNDLRILCNDYTIDTLQLYHNQIKMSTKKTILQFTYYFDRMMYVEKCTETRKNMSTKKNKNKKNKRENNIKSREERLKDIAREDRELDEIEKLIADNESEYEPDDKKEIKPIATEDNSKKEQTKKDNAADEDIEDDFFAKLDKEDIKTFKVRKSEKKKKNVLSDGIISFIAEYTKGNTRYAIWGSVLAVLIISLIIALAVDASNKDKDYGKKKIAVNTSGELIPSQDKEIVELVKHYYKAVNKCDTITLENILDSSDGIDIERLKSQSQYIEGYNNIKCYVKNGLKDDEYIVYVYYEIKILDIATQAPGAEVLYVVKSSDGSYKICNNIQDNADVKKLIDKLSKSKDVEKFNSDVDKKMTEACEKDEDLKKFYDALMSASAK